MLIPYIDTTVGAFMFFFVKRRRIPRWEMIFPIVAVVFLFCTIYKNVYPAPAFPYNLVPYVVAAWLAIGLLVVLVSPGLAKRIGAGLAGKEVDRAGGQS